MLWKVCSFVVNFWRVVLHNSHHGFREGRETETSTLEANHAQQLAGLVHYPLLQFFLDVHKVYD